MDRSWMFLVILSTWVIIKKQEGASFSDYSSFSRSQPKNICHKLIFKAYCLITPASTSKHHYALLDSIV